jgi:anthranilate/para-aminobenzoate synthase component I
VVVRALSLPPDPLRIAGALRSRPGLAVLASSPVGALHPEDARWSFVACEPDAASEDLVPPLGPARVEPPTASAEPAVPRWIGVLPYDALRGIERRGWTRNPDTRSAPLHSRPSWRRYPAVVRIDHLTGAVTVEAESESAADALCRALRDGSTSVSPARAFELRIRPPDEPPSAHLERIRAALALIADGDLYQVNLARPIHFDIRGDTLSLFASLLDAAPAPWGYYLDLGRTIVAASSPELALSVRGGELRTCPIKGTRPRAASPDEDARLAHDLDADPKERAELVMAIDVHRNDLGAVAVPGSVRLSGEPRLAGGRTVWSRVAEIVGTRAPGVGLEAIVRSCLPCGSVTGAPKVRAMEVIARLEPWRRGAYTGVFGYLGRDGSLSLAMAIRTAEIAAGGGKGSSEGVYFTGGGIVADSIPEREFEETRWKAAQLERLQDVARLSHMAGTDAPSR